MKKVKPVLAGLLAALILLLAACNQAPDDSSGSGPSSNPSGDPTGTPTGRYVEKDVTPPGAEGGNLRVFTGTSGLVCLNGDLTTRWDSSDGGDNWTESPITGLGAGLTVDNFTYNPHNDSIILSAYDENMSYVLYTLGADGAFAPLPNADYDEAAAGGKQVHLLNMEVTAENRLLLSYYLPGGNSFSIGGGRRDDAGADGDEPDTGDDPDSSLPSDDASLPEGDNPDAGGLPEGAPEDEDGDMLEASDGGFSGAVGMGGGGQGLYDLTTGAKVADLSGWDGGYTALAGGVLYLMDYAGQVSRFDSATGERLDDPTPLGLGFEKQVRATFGLGDKLAYLYGSDLYTLAPGDAEAEPLLNGGAFAFGSLAAWISGAAEANGSPVLAVDDGNGTRLYRYNWDPNATIDPNKTLEVWSLYDDMVARAALLEFGKQHPDALINYTPVLAGDATGQSVDDAIKALNTRLLAGDAPDVLILDGCPVESYGKKGMLANLADYLDTGAILPSVLKAFETDKGLFSLPARAKIPVLVGNPDLLAQMDSLEKLVKTAADGPDRPEVDPESMFAALPEDQRPVFSFGDWDEFYDLLLASCQPGFIEDGNLNAEALTAFLEAMKGLSDKYGLTTYEPGGMIAMASTMGALVLSQSVLNYSAGTASAGVMQLGDVLVAQMMMLPDAEMAYLPGLGEGTWIPSTIAGISADSKNPAFAGEFISTLFSDTVQGALTTGSGLPVTTTGVDKMIESSDEQAKLMDMTSLKEQAAPQCKALLEKMGTPVFTDAVLSEKLKDAARAYCDGSLDLQGAVSQIEQELKNYLAERA